MADTWPGAGNFAVERRAAAASGTEYRHPPGSLAIPGLAP
jgi:hypothetical protein